MGFYNVVNRALMQSGQAEDISQVVANLDAIAAVLNGAIDNTNVAAGAAIDYSKLNVPAAAIAIAKLTGYPADGTKALFGDATWKVPVAGTLLGVQNITATGTYTPTAGTTKVYIECIGGGGGSGGCAATSTSGTASGGGGGGGYSAKFLTAAFSGKTVTIGAAGTAGTAGANNGGVGGDTTFDATVVVAKGGLGGIGSASAAQGAGGLGGAGASGTGDVTFDGGAGGAGFLAGQSGIAGMGGGTAHGSPQGPNGNFGGTSPARVGARYGGGASGVSTGGTVAAQAGAAGAQGICRIWEFA
jgi:hypothetical protein